MQTHIQSQVQTTVMTVKQAANYLGLAVSTLNKWRCIGEGPVFIKMGRAVRYRQRDLDMYMSVNTTESTSFFTTA